MGCSAKAGRFSKYRSSRHPRKLRKTHAESLMRLTRLMIAMAPMLFVLLWSTGFIGARFVLPYIEPMTFLAACCSWSPS
jgi:hypothetical protein